MAAQKKITPGPSARYRRNKALKGCRRVDVILVPKASAALGSLERNGMTTTRAVTEALQLLAKSKGLT